MVPFWVPIMSYDNTAPNILGTQKGTIILTTTHIQGYKPNMLQALQQLFLELLYNPSIIVSMFFSIISILNITQTIPYISPIYSPTIPVVSRLYPYTLRGTPLPCAPGRE